MRRWKEKLLFAGCALAFLIPISLLQDGIDRDEGQVAFLRWIDNQEAYRGQVLQKIITEGQERSTEEAELFDRVEEIGHSIDPGFDDLPVDEKWRVINSPGFRSQYGTFIELAKQQKLTLVEGEIQWADPDVSANVGALVLGFRKLVADMLWLKFDEYWHMGLVERMMPMMETVVALDPHFIEAYALGAWHLAYNVTAMFASQEVKQKYIHQGIRLLEQGIKNNPRSSKLYAELGYTMYFRKVGEWEKAAYYLGEAVKYEHEPWVERAYALSLERLGKEEKALAVFEDYDRRHPDFIAQKSSIARLRKKLRARELEEEGKLKQAFEIWEFLKEDDPSDVVAPREYLRLRAIVQQGRSTSS